MVRVVLNTLVFRVSNVLSREAIFLAIFIKSMADLLGVKLGTKQHLFKVTMLENVEFACMPIPSNRNSKHMQNPVMKL